MQAYTPTDFENCLKLCCLTNFVALRVLLQSFTNFVTWVKPVFHFITFKCLYFTFLRDEFKDFCTRRLHFVCYDQHAGG